MVEPELNDSESDPADGGCERIHGGERREATAAAVVPLSGLDDVTPESWSCRRFARSWHLIWADLLVHYLVRDRRDRSRLRALVLCSRPWRCWSGRRMRLEHQGAMGSILAGRRGLACVDDRMRRTRERALGCFPWVHLRGMSGARGGATSTKGSGEVAAAAGFIEGRQGRAYN